MKRRAFLLAPLAMIAPSFFLLAKPRVVNVKDFGAKGDGITDDTAAIASAITSVVAGGGQLYFPVGVYKSGGVLINRQSLKYRENKKLHFYLVRRGDPLMLELSLL